MTESADIKISNKLPIMRRRIGTFYLLVPKLVFCNSDLNKIDHRLGWGATKAMSDLSGVISMALKLY